MINKKNALAAIACAALLASSGVQALDFTETTDFPNAIGFGPFAASVGTLALGANSVTAALDGICEPFDCNFDGDSQDSFLLTVALGTLLSSITLTTANVSGPDGFSASFAVNSQADGMLLFVPNVALGATTANLLTAPLGEGVYALSVFGQSAFEAGAFALDYVVDLDVTAVPLPGAFVLLAPAALLLASARRRT